VIKLVIILTLVNGSAYALLALGLSLIFGVGRLINMAHTAFFVVAAYIMYYFIHNLGWGAIATIVVTVVGTALLGALCYMLLINRVRQHAQAVLLITVALAMAFQEILYIRFGSYYQTIDPLIPGTKLLWGIIVPNQYLLVIGAVAVVLIILWLLLSKTKLGIATRAVANDAEIANVLGINVPRTLLITMSIATALAAVAAVLIGPVWLLYPPLWSITLTTVLVIVVLGGLGSIKGSIIGAYIIALVEQVVLAANISPNLVTTFILLAMIIVLVVRPGGLFGIILEEERL
jgi:branched-chain amino acid transport system permease protein